MIAAADSDSAADAAAGTCVNETKGANLEVFLSRERRVYVKSI